MIASILITTVLGVYLLLTSPTWLEAFIIDPWFWIADKSDKPASTWIRGGLFIIVSLISDFVLHYGHWYYALGVTFLFHVLTFAFMINIKLKKPIDYLGSDKYDQFIRKIPLWIRVLVSGILLAASVLLFEFLY